MKPVTAGSIVVDASVALPLVHPEPLSAHITRRLAEWHDRGLRLIAPVHCWLEVVNSLARRHGYSGAELLEAVSELDHVGIDMVPMDRPLLLLTIDVLERHALTGYDAAYLALAHATDARLATSDRALARAAGERAIFLSEDGQPRLSEGSAHYEVDPTWPGWRGSGAHLARLRADAAAEGEQTSNQAIARADR